MPRKYVPVIGPSMSPSAVNSRKICCPKCGADYSTDHRGRRFCKDCAKERAKLSNKGTRKGPPNKTLEQYEREAVPYGECLIHWAHGAARRVYILRHGPLDSRTAVCHTCDTPSCINDAHHFIGSWRDNVLDAVLKGRHSCCRKGAESNRHKLTEEQALEVLRSAAPLQELADKFGVHISTISKIRTGKNWSHLCR